MHLQYVLHSMSQTHWSINSTSFALSLHIERQLLSLDYILNCLSSILYTKLNNTLVNRTSVTFMTRTDIIIIYKVTITKLSVQINLIISERSISSLMVLSSIIQDIQNLNDNDYKVPFNDFSVHSSGSKGNRLETIFLYCYCTMYMQLAM